MTPGRIVLILLAAALCWWLYTSQGKTLLSRDTVSATERGSPTDRARAVAREAERLRQESERMQRESESGPPPSGGGYVTENMTPDQIRRLLGAPDEVSTETSGSGAPRERWTYRAAGKTVIFENGIAVRVE